MKGSHFSNLFEALLRHAETTPDKVVFTFRDGEERQLTYAELVERASRLATAFSQSIGSGNRAVLAYPPGLDFIEAFFACLLSGVVAVPVSPPRRSRNGVGFAAIVRDCSPAAVLCSSVNRELIAQVGRERELIDPACILATDEMAEFDGSDLCNCGQLAKQLEGSSERLAFIQYTSGSTAAPRGVMLSHANLLHNLRLIEQSFENTSSSRGVFWLPLFHDMGLIGGVLQTVFTGGSSLLLSPTTFLQQPIGWLRAISEQLATVSGGPNFAYDLCVRKATEENCRGLDLSRWELAFTGAEPVLPETLQRFTERFSPYGFRQTAFYPCYGLAEATLMVTGGRKGQRQTVESFDRSLLEENIASPGGSLLSEDATWKPSIKRMVSCGACLANQDLIVVDVATLQSCETGQVGEIWLRGPSVAQGYYQRPEETAETFGAFTRDGVGPYLRTGDLGVLSDGELYITGRMKEVIIVRGKNLYPVDIEHSIHDVSSGQEAIAGLRPGHCAAFSVNNENEEQIVVVQELEPRAKHLDHATTIGAIRERVAQRLDVAIHTIILCKAGGIPRTSSGKIQRLACKAAFTTGQLKAVGQWSRQGELGGQVPYEGAAVPSFKGQLNGRDVGSVEIEGWLSSRLSRRLNVPNETISVHKAFFDFGMSSLDAVEMTDELSRWLDLPVSPTLIYHYPTIASLSHWLADQKNLRGNPLSSADRTNGEMNGKSSAPHRNGRAENGRRKSTGRTATLEPIAIVGVGCRFPGDVDSLETFWQLMQAGVDAIREVPDDRWDVDAFYDANPAAPGKTSTRWGGFIDNVGLFDAEFFGISPREARRVDPQQRVLMEVAWEALEDAGIDPANLSGSHTGVFVGALGNDYALMQMSNLDDLDVFTGTGNSHAIIANRLSYFLDLRGPSLTLDTACSSSLVTVHLACQSLLNGESNLALAGGVNLILAPEMTIALSKASMMAPDGRCKAFDSSANGYVRSEGCAMVVLKRLTDALADGDRVLGIIRGSAVNHDGRSNGLSAPNGPAQEAVIRAAFEAAGLSPLDVNYVEAHGTGTKLGDPIEIEALKNVYCTDRTEQNPLCVGSVKTNIGHTESVAGIAGLLKSLLVLQHQQIPPHLHLRSPNPLLNLQDKKIRIVTACEPCPDLQVAGVNSFGFGGTNAHLLLERPTPVAASRSSSERTEHVLTLSARSKSALEELAQRWVQRLSEDDMMALDDHPAIWRRLGDLAFTANVGRTHFNHRMAIVTGSAERLREQLRGVLEQELRPGVFTGKTLSGPVKVGMLFSGQGAQYAGMGHELYGTQPVYRQAVDECSQVVNSLLGCSLSELLTPQAGSRIDQTRFTQPALFALQYALASLWKSWGIEPQAVMGHSVGEVAAACVAGAMSLHDALHFIVERAAAMQEAPAGGVMVAVMANAALVAREIKQFSGQISIAAYNGPENTVLSGERQAVANLLRRFDQQGIVCKELTTSHAFHSSMMDPILDRLTIAHKKIGWQKPSIPWVSNVTGRVAEEDTFATDDYWARHAREPVHFDAGVKSLVALGCNVLLEIGPGTTLIGMARRCVSQDNMEFLPSLKFGASDCRTVLTSLAQLHVLGANVDWNSFDRDYGRSRVRAPGYPFERRFYFAGSSATERRLGTAASTGSQLADGYSTKQPTHALVGSRLPLAIAEAVYDQKLTRAAAKPLGGVGANDRLLLRSTDLLEAVLLAARDWRPDGHWKLESVVFQAPLIVGTRARNVQTILAADAAVTSFRMASRELAEDAGEFVVHVRGNLVGAEPSQQVPVLREQLAFNTSAKNWPDRLDCGLNTPAGFKLGRGEIKVGEGRAQGRMQVANDQREQPSESVTANVLHNALELLLVAAPSARHDGYFRLQSVEHVEIFEDLRGECLATARVEQVDDNCVVGDVAIFNTDDVHIASLRGVCLEHVPRDWFERLASSVALNWLHGLEWREAPLVATDDPALKSDWIFIDCCQRLGEELARKLTSLGHRCEVISRLDGVQDADIGEQLLQAVNNIRAFSEPDSTIPLRVVQLSNLSEQCQQDESGFATSRLWGWGSLLNVVQTITARGAGTLAAGYGQIQLSCVTAGAHAPDGSPGLALAPSLTWGMARVIASEHPELACRRIDLSPDPTAWDLDVVVAELIGETNEDQVMLRPHGRWVQRLVRTTIEPDERSACASGGPLSPTDLTPELQLRGDGIYLVTGGLGGLGLALARWLSDRGAGHVVLVGRSAPSAQAIEGMQAIMQAGSCLVSTAQCDIGDSTAVVELIAGLKACDGRRLRGVFHLAGVLDDGMLREQTMERFERVLSPKAVGGWNLHIHTLGLPLDYFVLFSSAAALLGSPGQANYAAANAYLDSLAHYRRAQGLPALSINWGSWAEAGMAARLKESEGERWAAIGNGWIDIPHGLRTLEWLMLRNCVQCGVLPIEWPKFVRALPAGMEPAWLSEILDEVAATNPVERPRPVLREELLTCDVSTRDEVALGHLTRMAMTVLSWDLPQDPDPDRIFSELGFDSLTGVEFCNAIGRSLDCHVPPTVLFDYSTLNRLTDYVVNELFATATAGQRSMASPVRPLAPPSQDNGDGSTLDEEERSQLADEVEGMSEEEMNAMIESQLQVLKRN